MEGNPFYLTAEEYSGIIAEILEARFGTTVRLHPEDLFFNAKDAMEAVNVTFTYLIARDRRSRL